MMRELCKYIDHTCLKPFSQDKDIIKLCSEAAEYHFASVCVNPCDVPLAKKLLTGSDVAVCTVIGFPLGKNSSDIKMAETLKAKEDGCDEFDMVINVGWLKDQKYELIQKEISSVVGAAGDKIVKVILETGLLTDDEIVKAVKISCDAGAKFVITLRGEIDKPLNRQHEVTERWEQVFARTSAPKEDDIVGQCAISGNRLPLARTHDSISGIRGGLATGVNLVCFNNTAFESYGRKQSYNSSISVESMKKYTGAVNYLTSSKIHKQMLGDMTLLYWAGTAKDERPYLDMFCFGLMPNSQSAAEADEAARRETDEMLQKIYDEFAAGRTAEIDGIDFTTQFYVLGLKPNSSRLSVKIFEKNSFGKILKNIARHCADMRFSPSDKPLSVWQIDKALLSPVTSESGDPALQAKLLLAILQGTPYPQAMLGTVVRRCRIDRDDPDKKQFSVSNTRARIIRASLRRQNYFLEDEYTMLQENSTDTAYNLGRLFAVLEKVQTEALGNVNATIKDKFFSSACTTPALVFPRLLKLAQPHLAKLGEGNRIYKDRLIGEILAKIDGTFPNTQSVQQQGMFILGYYQQKQKLYEKTEKGE